MMKTENKIKILENSLIDKIAAGEVVENPSSVVKELLENSIDAKADKISIEIKEGGKSLIKISDNGIGMNKEDAKLSIIRHSTSKIQNTDDLFKINTLGFRGEALASICAVSKFEMLTRQKDDIVGTQIITEKENIIINEIGTEIGTSIKVKELFFNVPARKKFLKNIETETRIITDIVTRYSLAYPNISFSLKCDNRDIINTTKTNNWLNTIQSVYGTSISKEMISIEYSDDIISINGFIGKPSIARNDKLRQTIFLNGRYIKSKEISEAIKKGYNSTIFLEKEPIFILNIKIDESKVDVNIHPRKEIVKITEIENISNKISDIIFENLKKNDLFPDSDLKTWKTQSKQVYSIEKDTQSTLNFKQNNILSSDVDIREAGTIYNNEIKENNFNKISSMLKESISSQEIVSSHLGKFKIIGQVNKTYILAENENGLMIIDQHAAEERANYEKLMKELKHGAVSSQELLQAIMLELSPEEMQIISFNKEKINKCGYDIDEYGNNSIIIRSVPFIFERPSKLLIEELIEELKSENTKKQNTEIEERIIRFSCRSSIKAGKEMTFHSMEKLLYNLDKCDLPFTCPHGRPTIIKLSFGDIEKKFKRSGWLINFNV